MRGLILALWLLLPWSAVAQGIMAAELDFGSSTIAAENGEVTVTLRLSAPAPYRIMLLDEPKRLVLDLQGVDFTGTEPAAIAGAEVFDGMRAGPFRAGWGRIVFDLREPYAVTEAAQHVSHDASGAATGATLRLRLNPVAAENYAGAPNAMSALWDLPLPTTPVVDPSRPQPLRVAIDPGHGGIDSGAVDNGLREADLMLDFARELTEKLIRAGFEVVLTRRKDAFMGLESRMTEARASGADLFISLHADALPEGQAAGASVFIWNNEADDRASRQLAARHDRADLVAGLDLAGTDDLIAATLMDMARADTQPRSETFAKHVSSRLAQAGLALHRNPVKGAAFSVLKSPDIPSVLVELGFLTDPGDRANLVDPAWRARMATAIAAAVTDWSQDDTARAALRRH
ncbi:AMIN domain-containing protein [Paracoccus aurantiacus]|uniref:N-acetylmuramoyl-L-alanine amidase n=1 Tax=Paracoccus aurantiacus TaxID=2599412 RepID=A0A5C6SAU3_9RHOB|nr:N-acetylmuramoyl-L-alanine amidase [Paracoccus aurantiacus]TXB70725.1 AMIN domain-containing protein [Paracoccus aurantiacus]